MELSNDKYDEVEVHDGPSNSELIEEYKIDLSFSSEKEVCSYYMKYDKQKDSRCIEEIIDRERMRRLNSLH